VKQCVFQGGLGVRDLRLLIEALLGWWLWRFMKERDNLWRKMVSGFYPAWFLWV